MQSVLIIGCGSIGERHLRCFQRTDRARVTACDASPSLLQTMATTYGVPVTADWERAIEAGGFDAVVICTPAHLHVEMALRVLRAGCHVLIEKPLSQSIQNVAELLRARDETGRKAVVAYVLHVYPLLSQVRDYILSGAIGPIRHVTSTSGQHFPVCRPAHAVHYAQTYYRDRKTGGGAIQDALTHTVNWIESVIGPTDSLYCDSAHQVLPGVTVEDTVNLCARHGDILVSHSINQFQAPNESTIQFNAAGGSVKVETHLRRWGVQKLGENAWTWTEVPPADRDAPFIAQAHRFLDLIEGKPAELCTLEAAEQTLRFNLAAIASSDKGVRVRCSDITD